MAEGGKKPPNEGKVTFDKTMEFLQQIFAEKMGLGGSKSSDDVETADKQKILEECTLDGVAKYIMEKNCRNIIIMAGAGISTSAGIPDFRSPGSGLYDNLQKYNLPDPQAIFEIGFFKSNPEPFFALAKELFPGEFQPTPCHYFVRLLNEKGMLLRHYTQNIDTLERVAGIPSEKLVEAHGTFYTSHCVNSKCQQEYDLDWMKKEIFADKVPKCEKCNYTVKPDIVFFGESLPDCFFASIHEDFSKCDALIILGTSLVVQPFASLIDRAPSCTPRLLINLEKAGQRNALASMLGMGGGMDFESECNTRDAVWLGKCDDGCQALADALGFGEELRKLVTKEHEKLKSKATFGETSRKQ